MSVRIAATCIPALFVLGLGLAAGDAISAGPAEAAPAEAAPAEATPAEAAPAEAATAQAALLEPPRVIHHVIARFPTSGRDRDEADKPMRMIVRVDIDAEGKPGNLEVVDTNLGKAYRRPALQAVSFWRFAPATRAGVPEPVTILVPVEFGYGDAVGSQNGVRSINAPQRVITAPRN